MGRFILNSIENIISQEEVKKLVKILKPFKTEHQLIRFGEFFDGGYLLPDDLSNITTCFSPGVSNSVHFEKDLLKRGINSYLADGSIPFAPRLRGSNFIKKYLSNKDTHSTIKLDTWVNEYNPHPNNDLILQIDIEGSEYSVINSTSNGTLKKFRIIVVEFHFFDQVKKNPLTFFINNDCFFLKVFEAINKLKQFFEVVHLHPNNNAGIWKIHGYKVPRVLEVTLLRKDRIKRKFSANSFPHYLDAKCIPSKDDLYLPENWYLEN